MAERLSVLGILQHFSINASNIHCYNTRYTATNNLYKMSIRTNLGKNQSLLWLHLEGPSNSSKKLKRVSAFPKKFTRYQSTVRTTNKKNFVLLMKQRSSRKFFLLCLFL